MERFTSSMIPVLLVAALLGAAAWCQQPTQEYPPIQGTIVQAGQGAIQVTDRFGMAYTIAIDGRTVICHFIQDRRSATPSPASLLRAGDHVVVKLLPPEGGVFVAARIGFWHEGETPRSEWLSPGGDVNPAPSPSTAPAHSSPVTETDKALPGAGKAQSPMPVTPAASVTDPRGRFSLALPAGWTPSERQQDIQFFTKVVEKEKRFMFFAVGSMSLPPEALHADIVTLARNRAQEMATQMQQYEFKLVQAGPCSVGRLKGATLVYSYRYMNGVAALDEDYYFRTAESAIVLHFESRPEMFEAFRKEIQQILQSLKIQ